MVTRGIVVAAVLSAVVSSAITGAATWAVIRPAQCSQASPEARSTPVLSEEERRKQVESFFAAPKQYETHGGQEMRPRW